MEIVFTILILLFSSVVTIILISIAAGLAWSFGGRFRKFFKYGLWALLISPLMFLYGGLIERNSFTVSNIDLFSDGITPANDGFKVVHISDLHLYSFRNREAYLEKIVAEINSLSPDVVLFTGDIVTYGPSEMDGLEDILAGLNARYGTYSVLGNHDYCIYDKFISEEERMANTEEIISRERKMGWKVLLNENVNVGKDSSICIVGIENISSSVHFPSYGSLDKAVSGAEGEYLMLMSHDPSFWDSAIASHPQIDLTLSGHTHAMQLSLFGYSPSRLLYRRYRGLHSSGKNNLYVNIGLGETAIMSRIGTPPEITLLTLHHK